MKAFFKSVLAILIVIVVCIAMTKGSDSQSTDQRQIEWFGTSTLKNVKEVYPQVALEIVEKDANEANYTAQIGPLTQKTLQQQLEKLLKNSGIRTTDKFNAKATDAPLSLNVTIFARVRNDTALPSYGVFVYTEALQPELLYRDNKIRSFSRTWPMVPIGGGTRALLFLTPDTIVDEITSEVTRQVRNFVIDYSNANPRLNIKIPQLIKQKPTDESPDNVTPPISVTNSESDPSGMKTGKVTRVEIEGGFWGIIGNDGIKYDPINLPDEFKKDGQPVRFEAKAREDQMSFHMWGRIVEIVKIEKIN